MMHANMAQQGHRYQYGEVPVLAMQSGYVVKVCEIDMEQAYPLRPSFWVLASKLVPLPMKYFHGEVPS